MVNLCHELYSASSLISSQKTKETVHAVSLRKSHLHLVHYLETVRRPLIRNDLGRNSYLGCEMVH